MRMARDTPICIFLSLKQFNRYRSKKELIMPDKGNLATSGFVDFKTLDLFTNEYDQG